MPSRRGRRSYERKNSPLMLSAMSNALLFYDPSPQRRHLHTLEHYPHPSQTARMPFYELFMDSSTITEEFARSLPSSSSSSSLTSTSADSSASPQQERVTPVVCYRSLLDLDDPAPSVSSSSLNSATPTDVEEELDTDSDTDSTSDSSADEADGIIDGGLDRDLSTATAACSISGKPALPPPRPLNRYNAADTSDVASIRSYRSRTSVLSWSRVRKLVSKPSLDCLPTEVLDEVCSMLPQQSLLFLTKTCRATAGSAYVYLYRRPHFSSTYRLAQFVSVITHDRTLASYVRELDLSTIEDGVIGNVVLAGWRDWKYRSEPLYAVRSKPGQLSRSHHHRHKTADLQRLLRSSSSPSPSTYVRSSASTAHSGTSTSTAMTSSTYSSRSSTMTALVSTRGQSLTSPTGTHPVQSPLLRQYATARDVPIGALIHIFRACPHIQHINLSCLPLAADYIVLSHKYKPTAFTSLLFVSDVPKSYTWREHETAQVYAARDLVSAILELRELKTLKMKNLVWINKEVINKILRHERLSQTLTYVDFRDCGMTRGKSWAMDGSLDTFKGILDRDD
ncbi:hypothetical protein V1511DRAFT_461737 [Dipodascopsis uninucleata]